jgi:restriction endonuclease S subunit
MYNIVTSKSDNATLNNDYAEQKTVKIPHKNNQDKIAEKISKLENQFDSYAKKLNELLSVQYLIK